MSFLMYKDVYWSIIYDVKSEVGKKNHETGNKVNVHQSGNDWINFAITSLLNAGWW